MAATLVQHRSRMSQTSQTPPASRRRPRPRIESHSLSNRLLARPEIGRAGRGGRHLHLLPVVAPAFRSPESFFTVLYQSSTIGIVAVGVGMLMIGGEFDLSAGVIVTTAGLFNAMFCCYLGINLVGRRCSRRWCSAC